MEGVAGVATNSAVTRAGALSAEGDGSARAQRCGAVDELDEQLKGWTFEAHGCGSRASQDSHAVLLFAPRPRNDGRKLRQQTDPRARLFEIHSSSTSSGILVCKFAKIVTDAQHMSAAKTIEALYESKLSHEAQT